MTQGCIFIIHIYITSSLNLANTDKKTVKQLTSSKLLEGYGAAIVERVDVHARPIFTFADPVVSLPGKLKVNLNKFINNLLWLIPVQSKANLKNY